MKKHEEYKESVFEDELNDLLCLAQNYTAASTNAVLCGTKYYHDLANKAESNF